MSLGRISSELILEAMINDLKFLFDFICLPSDIFSCPPIINHVSDMDVYWLLIHSCLKFFRRRFSMDKRVIQLELDLKQLIERRLTRHKLEDIKYYLTQMHDLHFLETDTLWQRLKDSDTISPSKGYEPLLDALCHVKEIALKDEAFKLTDQIKSIYKGKSHSDLFVEKVQRFSAFFLCVLECPGIKKVLWMA